jgi:hypothetical protein
MPIGHGQNSSSPTPRDSLFVLSPDAVFKISSKISRPKSRSVFVPSAISPQLISISPDIFRYMGVLEASFRVGAVQPFGVPWSG